MMTAPRKVRVPQAEGDIVFSRGGDPDATRRFIVSDHLVSPRNTDEQQELLLRVDGARLATKTDEAPATSTPAPAGSPSGGSPKE